MTDCDVVDVRRLAHAAAHEPTNVRVQLSPHAFGVSRPVWPHPNRGAPLPGPGTRTCCLTWRPRRSSTASHWGGSSVRAVWARSMRAGTGSSENPARYCTKWPVRRRTRCAQFHTGNSPRGIASPNWRTGVSSMTVPKRIMADYEALLHDYTTDSSCHYGERLRVSMPLLRPRASDGRWRHRCPGSRGSGSTDAHGVAWGQRCGS